MKSISELNSKWYWRLIKVIYIILFLIILIFWLILIIETYWKDKIDTNNTKVICYYPDDRQFLFPEKHKSFTLKEVWINELNSSYYFKNNGFDYKNFITNYPYISLQITLFCINYNNIDNDDYNIENIEEYNTSWIDMLLYQKSYELRFWKNKIILNNEITKEEDEFIKQMQEYINYVNNSYSNYDRVSKLDFSIKMFDLKIKYLYWMFILYLLWYLISLYLVFEFIRRIFYYIILWKIFPKKD
jgi:hypothetical protein